MTGAKAVQQVGLVKLPPAADTDHAGKHKQAGEKTDRCHSRQARGCLVQQIAGGFQPVSGAQRDYIGDVLCQPLLGFPGRLIALVDRTNVKADQVVQCALLQYALEPESGLQPFLPVNCTDFDVDALILCSKGELVAHPQSKLVSLPILHGHVSGLPLGGRRFPPVALHQFQCFGVSREITQFVFISHGFSPSFGVIGENLRNRLLVNSVQTGTDHRKQLDAAGGIHRFQAVLQRFHLVREHFIED